VNFVTFGSPRCGNQAFVDYFEAISGIHQKYRTLFQDDPVPSAPPCSFDFTHLGKIVHYYDCSNLYYWNNGYTDVCPFTHPLSLDCHSDYRCIGAAFPATSSA